MPNYLSNAAGNLGGQFTPTSFGGNYGTVESELQLLDISGGTTFERIEVDDAIHALSVLDREQRQPTGQSPVNAIFDQQVSIILNDLNSAAQAIASLEDEDQVTFLGAGGTYMAAQDALASLVLRQDGLEDSNGGNVPPNTLGQEIAELDSALLELNLDLAGIVLEADEPDNEGTRLADDLLGNGQAGVYTVRADINGDGVIAENEIVALLYNYEELHTFNVFFDQVRTSQTFTANSLEVMKQSVFGGGPTSGDEGWRLDGYVDDWNLAVGDEVRGLSPVRPAFIQRFGHDRIRRWLEGLRVSTYGTAGVRIMELEGRFAFLGLDSILGRTEVTQENDHYVLGPQLGVGWVAEGPTVRLEAALLGLVGYGRVERRQGGVYGTEAIPGALNRAVAHAGTTSRHADGDDHVAWHGESRLTAGCQLTKRLRFDATWRWMVTGPVSSAYESVAWNAPDFGLQPTEDHSGVRSDWFFGLTYTQ